MLITSFKKKIWRKSVTLVSITCNLNIKSILACIPSDNKC